MRVVRACKWRAACASGSSDVTRHFVLPVDDYTRLTYSETTCSGGRKMIERWITTDSTSIKRAGGAMRRGLPAADLDRHTLLFGSSSSFGFIHHAHPYA